LDSFQAFAFLVGEAGCIYVVSSEQFGEVHYVLKVARFFSARVRGGFD